MVSADSAPSRNHLTAGSRFIHQAGNDSNDRNDIWQDGALIGWASWRNNGAARRANRQWRSSNNVGLWAGTGDLLSVLLTAPANERCRCCANFQRRCEWSSLASLS